MIEARKKNNFRRLIKNKFVTMTGMHNVRPRAHLLNTTRQNNFQAVESDKRAQKA